MDFGLARRSEEVEAGLTQDGAIIGTPSYLAPEQIEADANQVGPAADVYALGVILYQLLCGRCPFEGPVVSLLNQISHHKPPRPTSFRPDIDPRLEAICLKAISKRTSTKSWEICIHL